MFSGKKKNEALVEKILLEKYDSYYRLAYSCVHNEQDAADIVQEGAYNAIKKCGSLKHPEYASTWLYRIMINEIKSFVSRRQNVSYDAENVPEAGREDTYEDVDLQRAMQAMEPKDRLVIEMKYFEGLKIDDIAKALDENPNTVKSRLYRGLKKLRINLGEA